MAILFVIAYHAGLPFFSGGYVGVDVFFVLSGYLITGLLVQEVESTGKVDLARFYARRARRLLPALVLVLLVTMAAGYILYVPFEQKEIAITSISTAAYVSNLQFAREATNYLQAGAATNPLLHTWSLSVEEQFYLGWPLLLLLVVRATSERVAPGVRRSRVLMLMAFVALASLALSVFLTKYRQPWAFFSSPTRAWEFAAGGIGALLSLPVRGRAVRWAGWVGIALLFYSAIAFSDETVFPGFAALIPVIGTVAILISGARAVGQGVGNYLSAWWLQAIGRLSYSWYLWHWPVLVFATGVNGKLTVAARVGCVALSFGLAAISYHLVETPIRFNRLLVRRSAYSLAMAATLTLLGVGASFVWRSAAASAAESPAQRQFTRASKDLPRLLYERDCVLDLAGSDVKKCYFGKEHATTTVVLFGDSHAAQWFPALRAVTETEGWGLIPIVKSACPPADVNFIHYKLKRRYVECEEWRSNALRMMAEVRPTYIVMTSMDGYTGLSEWGDGLKRTLDTLSSTGAQIVYLRDTPRPGFNVPECLARAAWQSFRSDSPTCTFERKYGLDEARFQMQKQITSAYLNVRSLDMTPYICPGNTCEPTLDDYVIYQDANHLTAAFVSSLNVALKEEIEKAVTLRPQLSAR